MASTLPSPLLFPSRFFSVVRFPPSLRSPPSPFGFFGSLPSGFGTQFRCSSFHRSRFRLTAATSFRLPTFSGLGLPLSFLLPFVSSGSAFPPFTSRSFPSFPLPSSALGSGYWAHRYTLKTEHRLFICNLLKDFTEPALWSSFRLISISQLHTLLRFHL